MNSARPVLLTVLLLVTVGAFPVQAESLRNVEEKIGKAWEQQTTIRAKIRISARIQAGSNALQVTGEGTLEVLRDDGLEQWRQSLTMTIPDPVGTESRHDAIYDGKSLYLINEMMGRREARVAPPDIGRGIAPPGGEPLLSVLKKNLKLKFLREDSVEDRPVYVIEGTPRGANLQFTRGIFYIDQATGLQLKQEIYAGQDLSPRVIILCEDVRAGGVIDPARFTVGGDPTEPETRGADVEANGNE